MAEAKIAKLSKELYENQSSLNPDLFGDSEDEDLFKYVLFCFSNIMIFLNKIAVTPLKW